MWQTLQRLALALSLIALTSGALVVSDWDRRAGADLGGSGKKRQVRLVELNNVVDVEETEHGVLAGLRESGLLEGRDYEVKVSNAQGDMATVNGLVDAALSDGADLLITLSTPTLQAAIQRARQIPVVFGYVASAVAAGAGRTDEDHLPNVTGIYFRPSYGEMVAVIRECLPAARRVGTLFVPAEVNSVLHKDLLVEAGRKAGLEVEPMGASTGTEVADAALALCSRRLDLLCQIPGNLTAAAFASIASAAQRARVPIFAFQTAQAKEGAAVVLARDYAEHGRQTGLLAARILRGEKPATIPFRRDAGGNRMIINPRAARSAGLDLLPAFVRKADEVMGK